MSSGTRAKKARKPPKSPNGGKARPSIRPESTSRIRVLDFEGCCIRRKSTGFVRRTLGETRRKRLKGIALPQPKQANSFEPQRIDRIHARSLHRRIEAE